MTRPENAAEAGANPSVPVSAGSPQDAALLVEALEALERCGCQYWACDGPAIPSKPMVTCHACSTVAHLRHRLGRPTRDGVEGSINVHEVERQAYIRASTGRAS